MNVVSRVAVACLACIASTAVAQVPELPAQSPKARAEQRVGVTDFSVDYSSPAVKGRPIWGTLVPFDQVWRTGANAATKLTASREFTFGDKKVPAGSYGIFTIPGKASWTVILSSKAEGGGLQYDPKADVARITVKPDALTAPRERLTFIFADTTDDATKLDLEWEKVRVSIPLSVDTKGQVAGNIDASLAEAWRPHWASARYLLETGGDLNRAMSLIDTSIAVKAHWWNTFTKASIQAKQGKKKEAIATAEQAQKLGAGDAQYESFGKGMVAGAIAEWKK